MTEMHVNVKYASYAVMYELSRRDFKRKLALFPEDQRHYFILASGIIGAENARRMDEVPPGVASDGEEFVSKLAAIADPGKDEIFREVLLKCLVETMKDELRLCCPNCLRFNDCLDLEHLPLLGDLFRRRAEGEETEALKKKIASEIEGAMAKTPYWESEEADRLCDDYTHHCTPARLGVLFCRYSEIAMGMKETFGIDYGRFQREMVTLNMSFAARDKGKKAWA